MLSPLIREARVRNMKVNINRKGEAFERRASRR